MDDLHEIHEISEIVPF